MDLNKRISVNFFFGLFTKAYLAHSPVFFKTELLSNICLDVGSASDFMSCESGRGGL